MHLIQKHSIHVDCTKRSLGNQLKGELGDVMSQSFYLKLDSLFDDYDHLDKVWEIERLPIEITITNPKQWREELLSQSLQKIEEFLRSQMPESFIPNSENITVYDTIGTTQEKYVQKLFIQYLKTGALPVNTISERLSKIYEVLIVDEIFAKELCSILHNDYQTILRWSLNIPEAIKENIANTANSASVTHSLILLKNLLTELFKTKDRFKEEITKNALHYEEFLEFLFWVSNFSGKEGLSVSKTNEIKAIAKKYFAIDIESFQNILNRLIFSAEMKKQPVFFNLVQQLKLNLTSEERISKQNTTKDIAKQHNDMLDALLETVNDTSDKKPLDSWYIQNAGLVILQPFLLELFRELKYLEGDSWLDEQCQHRAVLITQYLMNSDDEIFENDLILNKIFCGVQPTDTVHTIWKIKPKEKKLCEQLLESVIAHWKILKNTSVTTLQESFLRRKGKLAIHKNGHYELTVEQKSIDLLVDKLPWGIGMVKTPWMETYLTCYWN